MPELWDYEAGRRENVDDTKVAALLKTGKYGITKDNVASDKGGVRVVSPDGKGGTVPIEDIHTALETGFRLDTEEDRIDREAKKVAGESPLTAAAVSAVDVATLGLASQLATAGEGGERRKQFLRALRSENPIASGAGSVIGGMASIGAGGVAGALGRGAAKLAGRTAATTLGKQVLQRAAQGALSSVAEGAVFGAGNLVSEEALGRTEFTAESVISHVGGGALIGGAIGGLFGGVAPLVGEAARKAAPAAGRAKDWIRSTAREMADESTIKALGARGTDIRKLASRERIAEVGQDILEYRKADGSKLIKGYEKAEDLLPKIREARQDIGKQLGDIRKQLDEYAARAGMLPDAKAFLREVDDEVIGPLLKSDVASIRSKANKIQRELAGFRKRVDAGEKFGLQDMEKVRKDLADVIYPKAPKGQGLPPQVPVHAEKLQEVERKLSDLIETQSDQVMAAFDDSQVGKFKKLKRLYSSFRKADDIAQKASLQQLGNRAISLSDYLSGLGGVGMSVATGNLYPLAAAGAHKLMRERSRSFMAVAADKVANLRILQEAVEGTSGHINGAINRFITGAAPAASAAGSRLAAISGASMSRSLTGDKEPPDTEFPKGSGLQVRAKKRITEIDNLLARPDHLADRIASGLTGLESAAPKVSAGLAGHAVRVAQFLQSKAPRNPYFGIGMQPQIDDWLPTPSEASKFARYYAAAMEPMTVVDELADGTLSFEGVEVLRELYPEIYEMTRVRLQAKLAETKKRVPYERRVVLSTLFGTPMDPSMTPQAIASYQSVFERGSPRGGGQGQAGGGARMTGLARMKRTADQMKTQTQQLEERMFS